MKTQTFEETLLQEWNIELYYYEDEDGNVVLDEDSIRDEFELKLNELINKTNS